MKRKTSRGKYINFDDLIAQQPSTPALGNMKVNARGDRLGKGGEIVESNTRRVRAYYRDNPLSSTSSTSLKDPVTKTAPQKPLTPDLAGEPESSAGNKVSESESSTAKPKTRRSRKKQAGTKHEQKTQDQKTVQDTSTESVDEPDTTLPPEPDEFLADTEQDSAQTPSIEVITDDGDIVMMTPSEYEAYQAEQQDESSK